VKQKLLRKIKKMKNLFSVTAISFLISAIGFSQRDCVEFEKNIYCAGESRTIEGENSKSIIIIYLGDSLFELKKTVSGLNKKNPSLLYKTNCLKLNSSGELILEGLSYIKNEKGMITSIRSYKNGALFGEFLDFDSTSNLITREYYDGQLNSKEIKYYPNGKIKSVGSNLRGLEIGYWQYFYPNGNLKEEGNYIKIEVESNNSLKKNTKTYYTEKSGEWKYYNEDGSLKEIVIHKND
jgi:antitoxin component YwqK of YwqJK toxin-antitoxin module